VLNNVSEIFKYLNVSVYSTCLGIIVRNEGARMKLREQVGDIGIIM
jgi:hypothetical protein